MHGEPSGRRNTTGHADGMFDRVVVDILPMALASISHDGVILDVNREWNSLYRVDSVAGKRYDAIGGALPAPLADAYYRNVRSLKQFLEDGAERLSMECPCADDTWMLTLFTKTWFGCIVMHMDITDAKKNELALAEERTLIARRLSVERERFVSLFNNMQTAVAIYRPVDGGEDFEFVDMNPVAEAIERVRRDDVVGRRVTDVFPGVRDFGLLEVFRRVYETGEPVDHPVTQYVDDRIAGWRDNMVFRLDSGEIVAVYDDVTRQRQAEETLRDREQVLRGMLNASTDSMLLLNTKGNIRMMNEIAAERLGVAVEEAIGVDVFSLFPDGVAQSRIKHFTNVVESGEAVRFVDERDGRHFDIQMYPVFADDESEVAGVAFYARDITRQHEAEARLRLALKAFEHSGEAILVTDVNGIILDVNEAFSRITGHAREAAIGNTPSILKSGVHDNEFYANMWNELLTIGSWRGEIWDRRQNGEIYPKMLSITAARDELDRITHFIAIFNDITKIKQTEQHLQKLAHFDTLTNLPNRLLFADRLDQAIHHAHRYNERIGLMFIDLDRFKIINDTLGHRAGDALLVKVAERLSVTVRETDTVARLGGDEFTILLAEVENASDVAHVAAKVLESFEKPFYVDNHEIFVTPSVGVTIFPDDAGAPEELVKNADTAMYRAKDLGRNMFIFYTDTMHEEAFARLELETELRHAMERDEFVLHYQPIVEARSGRIASVEALLRWNHPVHGMVRPDHFIPLAEDTGLIIPIGRWVIMQAVNDIAELNRIHGTELRVAVNVSGRQVQQHDLVEQISIILTSVKNAGDILTIELTESTVMDSLQSNIDTLNRLRGLGLKLSVDDFGTGYSSLSYIKRLPLDTIKIDRSFVKNLPDGTEDIAITRAIIAMANAMNLSVTAEGVETEAQLGFLRKEGADYIQGFYYAKPLPVEELSALIADGVVIERDASGG